MSTLTKPDRDGNAVVQGDFLSFAAHQLRTPLTALQLAIQSMSRTVADVPPSEATNRARRVADTAERESRRLARMIANLFDAAEWREKPLVLEPERVDAVTLVKEVIRGLRLEIARSACSVRLLGAPAAVGEWDRVRLEQLMVNLILNAVTHAPGQPIDVTIEQATPDVTKIAISDHGPGVPPTLVRHLYEPFRRGADHGGSLGLGLFVAHAIVQAHEGRIVYTPNSNHGATFAVSLPRWRRKDANEVGMQ
jgi:signal transduction histidine kinase